MLAQINYVLVPPKCAAASICIWRQGIPPIYAANCTNVVAIRDIFTFQSYVEKHCTDVILIVD